jgi:hypothetical protein
VVGCFLQQSEREKGQSDRAYGMNHCGSVGRGRGYFCQAERRSFGLTVGRVVGMIGPRYTLFARYKEASADVE